MKKLFTIAAAAFMAVAGAAQSTECLYGAIDAIPWNCEITGSVNENVAIKLSGSGSVFNLASEDSPINLSQYKGVRVEYANASDEIQLKVSQDDVVQEIEMEENETSATMMFSDDVMALGILTSLAITTWDLGQSVLFKNAYLIANDGTEVLMANVAGTGSGANIAVAQFEVSYTAVGGRVEIVDSRRKSIEIDPEYDEKSYVYSIEFSEPTTQTLSVVCNSFLGTTWSKEYPAGTTTITFTPADEFGAGAYSNTLYLQALSETAAYPFTVKVKSMTRTVAGGTGIKQMREECDGDNGDTFTISGTRATRSSKGIVIKNKRKYVR